MLFKKTTIPSKEDCLPGREEVMPVYNRHEVLGTLLDDDFEGMARLMVGMGCFWGAERKFWSLNGVVSTAVGYAAGHTPNPTYQEVCSGQTGHNEVVRIIYDPSKISLEDLLKTFWENHNPTQGMRQGNDAGTQYRSGLYCYDDDQKNAVQRSLKAYGESLKAAGHDDITTEVIDAPTFYFAEEYHQQYLHKNPGGYCGLGGTGVSCPIGLE